MERIEMRFTQPTMETGGEMAETRLYGVVVPDMGEWYKKEYPEDKSASDFCKVINALKAKGIKRLRVAINSPGGDVFQAASMRTALMEAGFEEIEIRIDGMCASAATIVASVPGARVRIGDTGSYMIHNPRSGAWGTAAEMEKEVTMLRDLEHTMHQMYARRTGQSEEDIKGWMDEETWFNAKEAVDKGFADEVIEDTQTGSAAAMVSGEMARVMAQMYRHVPESIRQAEEEVSTGDNTPTEYIHQKEREDDMEIKDLTMEELVAGNPELVQAIVNDAMKRERERVQDIRDMTAPGYEELRDKAIQDGVSAVEYNKLVVAAMKEKRNAFIGNRAKEAEETKKVEGGAAEEKKPTDEDEDKAIQAQAKEIAELSAGVTTRGSGMY